MVKPLVVPLVVAWALVGCIGQPASECKSACEQAKVGCFLLNLEDCQRGCETFFDDDTLACARSAVSCDDYLGCHHLGVCEVLCGDANEVCGKLDGCTADCRAFWNYETALCIDAATSCADQFLCVTL